jgi:hypothetical protein
MSKPNTVVGKALAAEQERLAALPHVVPSDEDIAQWHGGRLVLDRCHYSGKDPEVKEHYSRDPAKTTYSCGYCHLPVPNSDPLPEHARALDERYQVREMVRTLCEVLGLDPWEDGPLQGGHEAESARAATFDGKIAVALPHLTAELVRRDASAGAAKVITDLLNLQLEGHEAPLFTEAGLYDLVGKGNARTVLRHTRALKRATGR